MGPETRLPKRNFINRGSTIYADDTGMRIIGKSLQAQEHRTEDNIALVGE